MKTSLAFEKHFLLITMSVVITLGVPVALSIVSAPPKIDVVTGSMAGRVPASVSLLEDRSTSLPLGASSSREVSCDNQMDLGSLVGAHLRLMTQSCGEFSRIEITNKTNGFTAETMPLKQGYFTSDFIDLSEGENTLEIARVDSGGQKTIQIIKATRLPASANQ